MSEINEGRDIGISEDDFIEALKKASQPTDQVEDLEEDDDEEDI